MRMYQTSIPPGASCSPWFVVRCQQEEAKAQIPARPSTPGIYWELRLGAGFDPSDTNDKHGN
jgi:hypothetical protein